MSPPILEKDSTQQSTADNYETGVGRTNTAKRCEVIVLLALSGVTRLGLLLYQNSLTGHPVIN